MVLVWKQQCWQSEKISNLSIRPTSLRTAPRWRLAIWECDFEGPEAPCSFECPSFHTFPLWTSIWFSGPGAQPISSHSNNEFQLNWMLLSSLSLHPIGRVNCWLCLPGVWPRAYQLSPLHWHVYRDILGSQKILTELSVRTGKKTKEEKKN